MIAIVPKISPGAPQLNQISMIPLIITMEAP
jgi:hypothetical protein